MTAEATLAISEKTASLAEVRAMLASDAYATLLGEISRVRAESLAKVLNLELSATVRDGAAGALNALDGLVKFLPALERSLGQTVASSRDARLG